MYYRETKHHTVLLLLILCLRKSKYQLYFQKHTQLTMNNSQIIKKVTNDNSKNIKGKSIYLKDLKWVF